MLGGSRDTAYLVTVASVLSSSLSLILHELGHALVARRNGLQVAGIELWALRRHHAHERRLRAGPGAELRVAAAGPLGDARRSRACAGARGRRPGHTLL